MMCACSVGLKGEMICYVRRMVFSLSHVLRLAGVQLDQMPAPILDIFLSCPLVLAAFE